MNDTQKMLQAIINGQSTIKQELSGKIGRVDQKVDKLSEKLDKVEKNLTGRIDKLGKQLAYLFTHPIVDKLTFYGILNLQLNIHPRKFRRNLIGLKAFY